MNSGESNGSAQSKRNQSTYHIDWVATFNYDESNAPEEYLGRVFALNIKEGLSEPFCINGSGFFNYKQECMIGKKIRIGLAVGKPNLDVRCWHGIVNYWKYVRDNSTEYERSNQQHSYIYRFTIIPEIQYKLSTRRSRIFYPSSDDNAFAENKEIKFNRAKLMDQIITELIQDNGIQLQDSLPNKKRKEKIDNEYDAIYAYYEYLVGSKA